MSGNRTRRWRLGRVLLPPVTTLNQQRQKKNDVRTQHNEENVAEPLATMVLNLNGPDGRSRHLEWIEFFHSLLDPANSVPAP